MSFPSRCSAFRANPTPSLSRFAYLKRELEGVFDDPTTRDGLADELLEVWDNIIEADKGKKRSQQPLNLVQQANGKLTEVDLTEAAPASLPAIEKQLDAIEASVGRLRTVIAAKKIRALQELLDDEDLHKIALDEENADEPIDYDVDMQDLVDLVEELEGSRPFDEDEGA